MYQGGLGIEVVKNLALLGAAKFYLYDPKNVEPRDLGLNLLIDEQHIGLNRVEASKKGIQALYEGCIDVQQLKSIEDVKSQIL